MESLGASEPRRDPWGSTSRGSKPHESRGSRGTHGTRGTLETRRVRASQRFVDS